MLLSIYRGKSYHLFPFPAEDPLKGVTPPHVLTVTFNRTCDQGPPEANNGGELDAFLRTCLGSSPKRAEIGDVRVITRDLRHITVSVQAYPLGTPEGGMRHMLLILEEVPVCAALPLPQTGRSSWLVCV